MFRLRSRLQRRDRESGLVFSWRVPVSSLMSFVVAVILVGGLSLALATAVRVRVGIPRTMEDRRGSLVIVPAGAGGEALERYAREAGPFPYRWNPAADPDYAALRSRALREAGDPTVPYHARIGVIDFEKVPRRPSRVSGILPPLPEVSASVPAPRPVSEPRLGGFVLRAGKGVELELPAFRLDPKAEAPATGRRYLVRYDAEGRVVEVSPLAAGARNPAVIEWLSGARVTGQDGREGGVVVETRVLP